MVLSFQTAIQDSEGRPGDWLPLIFEQETIERLLGNTPEEHEDAK